MKQILLILSLLIFTASSCDNDKPSPQPPAGSNLIQNTDYQGHAGLHCLVGRAWADNCDQIVQTIKETNLKKVAFNVLVGGGFGNDVGRLKHIVHELTEGGRELLLEIYITNGPSQRGYQTTPVNGLGTKTSPEDWRWQVQYDPNVRQAYKNIILRYKPVYELLLQRGGKLAICPALEDNLTDAAFESLKQLTLATWHEVNVHALPMMLVRNPCENCYPGNQGFISGGVFVEHHKPNQWNYTGSIATNDGIEVIFGTESTSYPRQVKLSDIPRPRGNAYIHWCAKCQGLFGGPGGDPNHRNYVRYTEAERQALISKLRE